MRPPPAGFSDYDFSAPLDEEELLNTARPFTVKGIALRSLSKEAEAQGRPLPGVPSYVAFKDYPTREHLALLFRTAHHLYPELPIREAMRRLGHRVYGSLLESMVGRALFGLPGMRVENLMKLIPRAYSLMASGSQVSLLSSTNDSALFSFRNFPVDLNSFDIGVFEGGFVAREKRCEVYLKKVAFGDGDLFCTWED